MEPQSKTVEPSGVPSKTHYVKSNNTNKSTSKVKSKDSSGKKSKSKSRPLLFWSTNDVNKWLRKCGGQYYPLYGSVFLEQDISGRSLIRLNDAKLQRLGICDPAHREDLLQLILRLKLKNETVELRDLEQKGGKLQNK